MEILGYKLATLFSSLQDAPFDENAGNSPMMPVGPPQPTVTGYIGLAGALTQLEKRHREFQDSFSDHYGGKLHVSKVLTRAGFIPNPRIITDPTMDCGLGLSTMFLISLSFESAPPTPWGGGGLVNWQRFLWVCGISGGLTDDRDNAITLNDVLTVGINGFVEGNSAGVPCFMQPSINLPGVAGNRYQRETVAATELKICKQVNPSWSVLVYAGVECAVGGQIVAYSRLGQRCRGGFPLPCSTVLWS